MEFSTDAKFSNLEFAPNSGSLGLLYAPVKNIYSEFGDSVKLNSVFDVYPGISGEHYRKEPVLRFNKLRQSWEINPYFLESNFISSVQQEPDVDEDDDDTNNPEDTQDTIQVPNIVLSSGMFETGSFELGGNGIGQFDLSLNKAYTDAIVLRVTLLNNGTAATDFFSFLENGDSFNKDFTFMPGETTKTVLIYEKSNAVDKYTGNTNVSVVINEVIPVGVLIGILPYTFDINVTYDPSDNIPPTAYITFNDNFSPTNFEDINSSLIPAILNDLDDFLPNDIVYVLYKGSLLNLDIAVTDSEDNSWKIIGKDAITSDAISGTKYVLMQIRGITLLTSSGRLPINQLKFVLLREGVLYNLTALETATGLTPYLNVTGIGATLDDNLINNTIDMQVPETFYIFTTSLTPSEFTLSNAEDTLSLLMNRGMMKISKEPILSSSNKTMNNLVDNNVYTTEVIDSWMLFEENNFANPIAFYSTVKMSGNVIIEPGDMLAAYVIDSLGNIEIRGVSSTDYTTTSGAGVIPWTYPGETNPVNILETTIFTNALKSTEFIKFRLFKKDPYIVNGEIMLPGNSVYELAQELPVGGINGITGGMYSENPSTANIFYIGRFSTVLNGPYDDFSFNVTLDSLTKEHIFVDGDVSQLPKIKAYRSQYYTAVQVSNGVWLSNTTSDGNLFVNSPLNFKEFYSVRLMPNVTKVNINIDGYPIKTQISINLRRGYNWVGYTMFRTETLQNVFQLESNTRLNPSDSLKAIITRDQGSVLVSNGNFFGSLSQMKPGGAYVLYINPSLPEDTLITLNYPATYNTSTVQNPSGYFKIDSIVNPLPNLIGDMYIYISDTEFGIAFINREDGTIGGIKTIGSYTGFGVHDTTMALIDPQTIEINDLGSVVSDFGGLSGFLTSIQLKAGFTALNGTTIDGANGVLDFVIRKIPDPLSFSDTEAVDYKLSEIGGLLPTEQSPPFKFTAIVSETVPETIQAFFGNFTPVVPATPEPLVVFQILQNENNKLQIQINLRKIIGSDENSKFNIFEIFFDNVDFGNADSENDVPVSTTDNVTIISPAILPFSILQAQGNVIQYVSIDSIPFGNNPIILEVEYITAPNTISIDNKSYITDVNYGKYTIPEFL